MKPASKIEGATEEEVVRLRACINDLIGILALPAMRNGEEPRAVVTILMDVLCGLMRLDFARVDLWPAGDAPGETIAIGDEPNPQDERTDYSIVTFRLGLTEDIGALVAGSRRPGFPTDSERLVLNVAANQAAVGLREARLLSEQKRLADQLSRKVAESTEALRHTNEQLKAEIAQRKSTEQALREVQASLSRATQIATLAEFSASIAHEINQPLAAVIANGHAGLRWLSNEPPNLVQAREAMQRIVLDGEGAGAFVQRIRSLYSGAPIQRDPVDVNDLIAEALNFMPSAVRRRVLVETDLPSNLPPAMGDRVQLQQVLLNLLTNAVEAMEGMEREGRISVRSSLGENGTIRIEVEDTGRGIEEPDRIFEAFYTTKETGTGMGLAISRSIIHAHDGSIWAEAIASGGTKMCFTVPLDMTRSDTSVEESQEAEALSPMEEEASVEIVYVVDDDPRIRQSLRSLLSSLGRQVVTYPSADAFLAADHPNRPSCLILDLKMPGTSGLELQQQISDSDAPPVVFISGQTDIPSSVQAMKQGALEFLPKPFAEAELLRAIDRAIVMDRESRARRSEIGELRRRYASLTPREREVLPFVVAGLLNKQTAVELGTSEITIRVHRGQIMRKMMAQSLADLVRMADRLGIPPAIPQS